MMSSLDVILYQSDSNLEQRVTQQFIKPKSQLPMLATSIGVPSLLHCSLPILNTYFYNKQQLKTKSNKDQSQPNHQHKNPTSIDSSTTPNSFYQFYKNEREKSFTTPKPTTPQPSNLTHFILLDLSPNNHQTHQIPISFPPFPLPSDPFRFQTAHLQSAQPQTQF